MEFAAYRELGTATGIRVRWCEASPEGCCRMKVPHETSTAPAVREVAVPSSESSVCFFICTNQQCWFRVVLSNLAGECKELWMSIMTLMGCVTLLLPWRNDVEWKWSVNFPGGNAELIHPTAAAAQLEVSGCFLLPSNLAIITGIACSGSHSSFSITIAFLLLFTLFKLYSLNFFHLFVWFLFNLGAPKTVFR